jgi:hypothetical protein
MESGLGSPEAWFTPTACLRVWHNPSGVAAMAKSIFASSLSRRSYIPIERQLSRIDCIHKGVQRVHGFRMLIAL